MKRLTLPRPRRIVVKGLPRYMPAAALCVLVIAAFLKWVYPVEIRLANYYYLHTIPHCSFTTGEKFTKLFPPSDYRAAISTLETGVAGAPCAFAGLVAGEIYRTEHGKLVAAVSDSPLRRGVSAVEPYAPAVLREIVGPRPGIFTEPLPVLEAYGALHRVTTRWGTLVGIVSPLAMAVICVWRCVIDRAVYRLPIAIAGFGLLMQYGMLRFAPWAAQSLNDVYVALTPVADGDLFGAIVACLIAAVTLFITLMLFVPQVVLVGVFSLGGFFDREGG